MPTYSLELDPAGTHAEYTHSKHTHKHPIGRFPKKKCVLLTTSTIPHFRTTTQTGPRIKVPLAGWPRDGV